MTTVAAPAPQMSHRHVMEAFTGLLAALFTAILSSTIVSNALPTIIADLKGTQTDFAWVITAAMLAMAVSTPIWGKLADLYDKKLLVQLGIVIFVVGSVVAGISPNMGVLLTARVVQGIGMGGLMALVQAIMGIMIPPRERGRYSGYLGGVLAVATAGGPLVGGLIVDNWGWRWTFYVCVPLAIIALILLQITLKLPLMRRKARIDWLGTLLLSASVALLLIWVSFAGKSDYYDWLSWQTLAMVGGSLVGLLLFVLVEARALEPIISLKIISERTTALAVIASVAIGVAMFGSASFIGQYFQVARGTTPTEAGLLTLPMILANLIGSTVAGQLISRFGRWKVFLVLGTILTTIGMFLLGTIDHATEFWLTGSFMAVLGLGLGMTMQNLVLAVQNTVSAKDIGSASASVAFFRTVGGAIGVSVLGAVLSNRSSTLIADGLAEKGINVPTGGAGPSLDIKDMPGPIADIVKAAFGDSTALIFLIAGFVSIIAVIAVSLIKEVPLRTTIDVQPKAATGADAAAGAATGADADAATGGAATGQPLGTSADLSSGPSSEPSSSPRVETSSIPLVTEGENVRVEEVGRFDNTGEAGAPASTTHAVADPAGSELRSGLDSELRKLLGEDHDAEAVAEATMALMQQTQLALAQQQLRVGQLLESVTYQIQAQQDIAQAQQQTAAELLALRQELRRDSEELLAARLAEAEEVAAKGRHSAN